MCKHSHLIFGQEYTLSVTGSATCWNCGSDTKSVCDGKKMIYRGHNDGMAIFDYVRPFRCPSCGMFTNGYGEYCGDLFFSGIESFEEVPNPIKESEYE